MSSPTGAAGSGAPVRLWWRDLDAAGEPTWLPPEEQGRLARVHCPVQRRRRAAARGFLREVLGARLGIAPAQVPLAVQAGGKPVLAGAGPRFNLAHSGNLALLALGEGVELGVDLEQVRPLPEPLPALTRRLLGARAWCAMETLPEPEQLAAFYRGWTRKEALLKGLGVGLMSPLEALEEDVNAVATTPPFVASGEAATLRHWQVMSVELAPGFAAALATARPATVSDPSAWKGQGRHHRPNPPHAAVDVDGVVDLKVDVAVKVNGLC